MAGAGGSAVWPEAGAGSKAPRPKTVRTDFGATQAGHPARSPPLEMEFAQPLAASEVVFEAIPELEFDQTANPTAEAGHDRLVHIVGVDAEPILEMEFDQTSERSHRTAEIIVRAARHCVACKSGC